MTEPTTDSIPHMLGWGDLMAGPPDVDWLIDGVLPSRSPAMLYANSGMGKSFTALDMALHIATGKPWQGRAVKQGQVYYIASENPGTLFARTIAWEAQYKGEAYWANHHKQLSDSQPPFTAITQTANLSSPTWVDGLLLEIKPARLIVIDTLLTSMGDGEIKDTSDSYSAIQQANRIARYTGATVLLVHHTPDKGTGPMGGSAWRGGLPVRIYLTRQRGAKELGESFDFQDGDTITLTCKKLTQAAHFDPIKIPVKVVRIRGGVKVPVLVSERAKKQRRAAKTTAVTPTKPGMGFQEAYVLYGDDRGKLAEVTGLTSAAIRKRISRINQEKRDAA